MYDLTNDLNKIHRMLDKLQLPIESHVMLRK